MHGHIIGLAGTNGSGKDTVGHILAESHGFLFVSVTELLRAELRNRNLPIDREHLRALSSEWRREYGLGVLVDRAIALYEEQKEHYQGVVMASLRNPHEAERIHELGGKVVWVDADSRIRYDRVRANAAVRGRAEEDDKTYEEFLADEAVEMHKPAGADETALDMSAVQALADFTLINEGHDLNALRQQIAQELTSI